MKKKKKNTLATHLKVSWPAPKQQSRHGDVRSTLPVEHISAAAELCDQNSSRNTSKALGQLFWYSLNSKAQLRSLNPAYPSYLVLNGTVKKIKK